MSNRRHAASPPNAPPLWRANCLYGRNAFSHTEITLWTSSLIFLARRPTPRSAEGPRAFADDCDEVRIGEQSPCAVQAIGKHRLSQASTKSIILEVPNGNATRAEHCNSWHPRQPVCRRGRRSRSRPTRWCRNDEHHWIALADRDVFH